MPVEVDDISTERMDFFRNSRDSTLADGVFSPTEYKPPASRFQKHPFYRTCRDNWADDFDGSFDNLVRLYEDCR